MPKYICTCQAAFGGEIVYCPRHDVALKSYKALKRLIAALYPAASIEELRDAMEEGQAIIDLADKAKEDNDA